MFIRKTKNRSGSISVQITKKIGRKNKVVKTVGVARTPRELELLMIIAQQEISRLAGQSSLFIDSADLLIDSFVAQLHNNQLQLVGPQLLLSPLYEEMGLDVFKEDSYLKPLIISRLVYPGSKLKTVHYLKRHFDLSVSVYTIYRYLDHLDEQKCEQIQEIIFKRSLQLYSPQTGIVFYDLTTLYFEAPDEDDLRQIGYSKDGKTQHPQIVLGLLVGTQGYPLAYQLFEGNTSETQTLIPMLKKMEQKFQLSKPIVVADAALLSKKNIAALEAADYGYILGARMKNESQAIQEKILSQTITETKPAQIKYPKGRLIISYSSKRAKKDQHNRKKGLQRLEKKVKSGKLTKENINNRGYNKYLVLEGEVNIKIDYQKTKQDQRWDGLKGYMSNTKLTKEEIISQYHNLWQIEKAFRVSKTDLRIRPIYHRIEKRIKAHICICFAAYALYKELERKLKQKKISLSPEKAIEMIKDIQQLTYQLPHSKQVKKKILNLNEKQKDLMRII